ncbi:MAG: FxsA family protein [Salinivenus sp.]
MLGRLLLLFLLTPAVELGLLIQVSELIGFELTIGLIIVTGIAGSYLARREGLNTWRRLNERLNTGDLPGKELVDGVIILMAGALLVTPGVLTDIVGFMGLLPPTRALIRRLVMRRFRRKMEEGSFQVQLGFFGGAAPGPNGPSPQSGPPPPDSSSADHWQGTGRQVPSHGDDAPADESGPDPTSDRSNGR